LLAVVVLPGVAAAVAAQPDVAAAVPDGEAAAGVPRPDGVVAAVPQPDAVGVPGVLRPDVVAAVRAGRAAAAPHGEVAARIGLAAETAMLRLRAPAVSRRSELHRVGAPVAAAVCRARPDGAAVRVGPMRSAVPAVLPARDELALHLVLRLAQRSAPHLASRASQLRGA
jgi:hypothetical protein